MANGKEGSRLVAPRTNISHTVARDVSHISQRLAIKADSFFQSKVNLAAQWSSSYPYFAYSDEHAASRCCVSDSE